MAEPSEERKEELILTFKEVTHSEDDAQARNMLEWYQWESAHAINAFMLGNFDPPHRYREQQRIAELRAQGIEPEPSPADMGMGGGGAGGGGGGLVNVGVDMAPTGPSGGGEGTRQIGMLSTIVGLPFRLAAKVLGYALSPINSLLGVEEVRDGGMAARKFISHFEAEYGREQKPDFIADSYREAVAQAARENKFLLVYLHSPLHQDTDKFCSGTLCSDTLVGFLEHSVLVWGGSVQHPDAYRVGCQLGATTFPSLNLLICKTNQVEIVERCDGAASTETLMEKVSGAMARFQDQLEAIRRQQREREEGRRLVQEQDAEYRESLEADRRRRSMAEEEVARQQREEEENRRREEQATQEREDVIARLREAVLPEPASGPDATRVRLQLPTGAKVNRRFDKNNTVQQIRDFLELYFIDNDIAITNFSMSTPYPKKTYGPESSNETLQEAGLHPQVALFITNLDA